MIFDLKFGAQIGTQGRRALRTIITQGKLTRAVLGRELGALDYLVVGCKGGIKYAAG